MSPEPTLIQRFQAEKLVDHDQAWVPMSGGKTNSLWRVGDVVVKRFEPPDDNPRFPNDPFKEIEILDHLRDRDLAPQLLGHLDFQGVIYLVYRHLDGPVWTKDTAQVGELLRRLHQVPAPAGLRLQNGGSTGLEAQANMILDDLPDTMARLLRTNRPSVAPVSPASNSVLLHGDPVPGNIIATQNGCRLIDWQCPAYGDAVEDLAIFTSPAMQLIYRGVPLTPDEISEFLLAYDHPEVAARFQALQPWHHWAMAAYCAWKAVRGATEYEVAMRMELKALQECLDQNRCAAP